MSHKFLILVMLVSLISNANGFTMKMIPIDLPHLKILPQGSTSYQRHQFLANISMSRALRHQKVLSPNDYKSPTFRVANSFFVTQLEFGEGTSDKGYYSPYLLLDTGSDLTWVQCEGCNPCFELSYDNFPYTRSTSFTRVSRYDALCLPPLIEYKGSCGVSISYGINSKPTMTGLLGRENFHFDSSHGSHSYLFQEIVFGCGLHNKNFDFDLNNGPHNPIAGIHGIGPGEFSMISQLRDQVKGRFSYCIPSLTKPVAARSTIYFGDDAQIRGDDTRQVQTISMRSHGMYHLYLTGISVEGNLLDIDSSIFVPDEDNLSKGFFIDSGTPITILANSAYNPLKEATVQFFYENYGWTPGPSKELFDLCYPDDPDYDERVFPTVTLHFWGSNGGVVNMELGKEHMFQQLSEEYGSEGFCMMLVGVKDPGPCFLGAFQQVNFRILHDISNSALSFVPENCLENPS